jgi:hypothetical protein
MGSHDQAIRRFAKGLRSDRSESCFERLAETPSGDGAWYLTKVGTVGVTTELTSIRSGELDAAGVKVVVRKSERARTKSRAS